MTFDIELGYITYTVLVKKKKVALNTLKPNLESVTVFHVL